MQLRRDFYKDIAICPDCKGLGVLNPEDSSSEYEFCDRCEGYGSYIDEDRGRVVIGLPFFVDYPSRQKLRYAKIVGITGLLLITVISAIIIF